MDPIDIIIFVVFAASVIAVGLFKSRGEKDTAEDYFLAGRGLTWPLIGISLIAANISAEQMVGMSGQAANGEMGLAIASYEWMAAITLIMVGFAFLPTFLKAGIFTIPQFLDYRYGATARTVMSVMMFVIFVLVNISTVTYLGAKFLDPFVDLFPGSGDIVFLSWTVATIAGVYIAVGGLKASAWADVIQGTALVLGGAIVAVLAVNALGDPDPTKGMNDPVTVANMLGVTPDASVGERLASLKRDHMSMFLPSTHNTLAWTTLLVGLWIPNLYYWGLNQYIVQRTLGAKSLAEGQKGIVFAASLKLVIPFVVCVPGVIAFTLYSGAMADKADEDTNNKIVEVFEQYGTAGYEGPSLFIFDDDYADRASEMAERMFAHNLAVAGGSREELLAAADDIDPQDQKPRTAGEVLQTANDALVGNEANASMTKSGRLDGYDHDDAFPVLVKRLAPAGLKGFIIAAVMGAVVSSLASMMNAASTLFTIDIYGRFINKEATQHQLVWTGRVIVVVSVIIGAIVAPFINNPALKGAFTFIQEFQGFISPGILTIFLFGLFVKRTPRIAGVIGLVLSPIIYGSLFLAEKSTSGMDPGTLFRIVVAPFPNRMGITLIVISTVLAALTVLRPLKEPLVMPTSTTMDVTGSKVAKIGGLIVVALTIVLYVVFA